ncbi:hypothetical protein K443DRAFT_135370 [Laccaria amethystina LaAM-08-1]|uniref:NAD(P)-binding protein n=1 Tax=Laccaria amethystina LaAM-08-1 TaxID=1095629 RepID=A0A0C9WUB5_9AGAR|nr:hypothetical protein K443DRAFT_135370 [Laccaria amethystina LaAM-08-1]
MAVDPDRVLKRVQFTKKNYRDLYPALESAIVDSQVGKNGIVTGASQGIGKVLHQLAFAKNSAKNLVLASRSLAKLEAAKSDILKINDNCNVLVVSVDTTSEMDGQKLEKVVKDNFGHADVLVNNSGQYAGRGNIEELDVKAWWSDFELNVKGTYLTTQSFLRLLPKTSKASVITVGSMTADLIFPGKSSYFVTLENPDVQAVVFHPGAVLTPMLDDSPEARPFALDTPELAGAFAVHLTTERAKNLNGKYASLEARSEDIVSKGLLTEELKGVFSSVG